MDGRGLESIAGSPGPSYVAGPSRPEVTEGGELERFGSSAPDFGDLDRFRLSVAPRAPTTADLDQPLRLEAAHRDPQPAALHARHVFPAQPVTRLEELLVGGRAARAEQPLEDLLLDRGDVVPGRGDRRPTDGLSNHYVNFL